MKVLFDCHMPAFLAHGGGHVQAINTVKALREIGVDADFARWWDSDQKCDILHFLGRVDGFYAGFARPKGIKFVLADLLTSQGSRTKLQRMPHWFLRQFDRATNGRIIAEKFGWKTYRIADAVIALTAWERDLMVEMFGADPSRLHVVPNGVEEIFFNNPKSKIENPQSALPVPHSAIRNPQSKWLVCTATITERKRVVELAEAAVIAQTPTWIIGKPYAESDPYFIRFLDVVRRSNGIVRYEGGISDRTQMADIYKNAWGFVLLSTMESLSLSALEAAAAGCPLLLSDLPWARCTFGDQASYCPIATALRGAPILKSFYDAAPNLSPPPRPATWKEVALQLKGIYEGL